LSVLVLSRKPLVQRPVHEWLDGLPAPPVLVTTVGAVRAADHLLGAYAEVVPVDAYDSWQVETLACELARRHRVDRVASSAEQDVVRAARLRRRLGLPGQSPESALAYRDKVLMKTLAAAAGVAVPPFAALDQPRDLVEFADRHGYPLVVKPRTGGGSRGVVLLHERAELVEALAGGLLPAAPDRSGELMVEGYVDGSLCHVDGVAVGGRVVHCWPSRYWSGNAEAVYGAFPLVGHQLGADDPVAGRLRQFAAEVAAALPASPDPHSFRRLGGVHPAGRHVRTAGGPVPGPRCGVREHERAGDAVRPHPGRRRGRRRRGRRRRLTRRGRGPAGRAAGVVGPGAAMALTPAGPRVAVLSKKDLRSRPYADWLGAVGAEVWLFAEDDAATGVRSPELVAGYRHVELFADWKRNRAVDLAVVEAHRRAPFDRIVALSECDVVRAARLREWLGVPGQSVASATAFRDKVVMKDHARAGGVGVPAYAPVDHVWDLVDLVHEVGPPVVVKPVDEAGARGVRVLADDDAVRRFVAETRDESDAPARLMVEEWVDAPLVSVDGVMAGGGLVTAMVNAYSESCYAAVERLTPVGLLQVDRSSPAGRRALDAVRALLAALPAAGEPTAFHCELFDHPTRGVLLCEIAARMGGARIRDMARHALGIDLERWNCLGQAGCQPPAIGPDGPAAVDYIGFLGLPAPGRRLVAAPPACPSAGVVSYDLRMVPGQYVPRAAKVSQLCVDVVFRADTAGSLRRRHDEVLDWLARELRWDDEARV
jgi:biotin carboxylase